MKVQRCSDTFKAMGSPCQVILYSDKPHLLDLAKQEVARLEQKYSRYLSSSVTSEINRNAGRCATPIDEETALLMDYAQAAYELSEGLFDISSGVLRRAWDFKAKKVPTLEDIAEVLPYVGWEKITRDSNEIYLPSSMELDFGGFVKEYAADSVVKLCRENQCSSGLVNLGGDVSIVGPRPDNEPWEVGITDPYHQGKAIAYIKLLEGALATSGNYERYITIGETRYSHILNPTTGWPVKSDICSVSVQHERCILAGTFATVAMLKGLEGREWLEANNCNYYIVDDKSTNTDL